MNRKTITSGWGKFSFLQLPKGYRFSVDSVLLASFVRFKNGAHILEAGAGEGIIPIFLSHRGKNFSYTGIEIQEPLAEIAMENLKLNKINGTIIQGDYRKIKLNGESHDIGIVNPPYYKIGTGRRNPDKIEEIARHEVKGDLESAIKFLTKGIKKKGKIFIIYPASRMETLFAVLKKYKISPKVILPVYSSRKGEAIFILCEGVKEGGEGSKLLQPIYIYDNPQKKEYSAEMQEIMETLEIKIEKYS